MMGSEVLVYFEFAGTNTIGKFDPDSKAKAGSSVMFSINSARAHLFDVDTEETITN